MIDDQPYGEIHVTVIDKESLANFIVRTIRLRKVSFPSCSNVYPRCNWGEEG